MNTTPLEELLKYTDAITVDLKGFEDRFYEKIISGAKTVKDNVLQNLVLIKKKGVWLELVNLVIPGYSLSK